MSLLIVILNMLLCLSGFNQSGVGLFHNSSYLLMHRNDTDLSL
jgi:hypothetical protein